MILSRVKFYPQERVDLEDLNTLLSASRTDAKLYTKQFLSGENYVLKGFTVSGLGLKSATVEMDNATMILGQGSQDFSYFIAENNPTDIVVPDADLVDGVRNYLELVLTYQDGTPITKAFWDPSANGGLGAEFNQQVNTVTDLQATVIVVQGGFTGNPDRIPLAIVDVDGSGTIKVILDRRPLFFRLGTPNDPFNVFSWVTNAEPPYLVNLTGVSGVFVAGETVTFSGGATAKVVTGGTTDIAIELPSGTNMTSGNTLTGGTSGATGTVNTIFESFTGADKDIDDFREVLTALMTEIKRLKGTDFWHQLQGNSMQGVSTLINSAIVGLTAGARYRWSGTELSISDDNVSPAAADNIAKIRLFGKSGVLNMRRQDGTGSTSTIALLDGQLLFVKLPASGSRNYSGIGSGDTNYQIVAADSFVINDTNYWIAFREGTKLYVRGYGELMSGESAEISDPISEQILTFIGATSEADDTPNYPSATIVTQGGSLVQAIGELDAATAGTAADGNQDRTTKLIKGGTWAWNQTTGALSWSASAFLQVAALADNVNEIAAGSATLSSDGQVAYVQKKRTAGASTLTVSVGAIAGLTMTDDIEIIARRVGNDVLIGRSFLLKDREMLELDGALAEINRYFGQLRLRQHPSNSDRVQVTGADVAKLDGSVLSQSLRNLLLAFDGAEIDFETGSVFAADGTTPLGINFTPFTVAANQWFWYSVTLIPSSALGDNRISAQLIVLPATATGASQSAAPRAPFANGIQLGQVAVQRNAGDTAFNAITQSNIIQLGVGGGGGGSGTGDANSDLTRYQDRLNLAPFMKATPNIASQNESDLLDTSTASYDIPTGTFKFPNIGSVLNSLNLLDSDFLTKGLDVNQVEFYGIYEFDDMDTNPTVEVSRDGGVSYQTLPVTRIADSDAFRGILTFANEPGYNFIISQAVANANFDLNATTVQSVAQKFTVSQAAVLKDLYVYINKAATAVGNYGVRIVKDSAGAPSTSSSDIVYESSLQPVSGLSTGDNIKILTSTIPLIPGDYHLVLFTDATYKAGYVSSSANKISAKVNSSGSVPRIRSFNGTAWSAEDASNTMRYRLEGRALDVRVRITGTIAGALLRSFCLYYQEEAGAYYRDPTSAIDQIMGALKDNNLASQNPAADFGNPGQGIKLKSPNGTIFEITVADDGSLAVYQLS